MTVCPPIIPVSSPPIAFFKIPRAGAYISIFSGLGDTIVILFLRGSCFDVVSSAAEPPRLLALLRDFLDVDEVEEISFRRGLGWIGVFSPLREGRGAVSGFVGPPMDKRFN